MNDFIVWSIVTAVFAFTFFSNRWKNHEACKPEQENEHDRKK